MILAIPKPNNGRWIERCLPISGCAGHPIRCPDERVFEVFDARLRSLQQKQFVRFRIVSADCQHLGAEFLVATAFAVQNRTPFGFRRIQQMRRQLTNEPPALARISAQLHSRLLWFCHAQETPVLLGARPARVRLDDGLQTVTGIGWGRGRMQEHLDPGPPSPGLMNFSGLLDFLDLHTGCDVIETFRL
jgi:hypothetical protein